MSTTPVPPPGSKAPSKRPLFAALVENRQVCSLPWENLTMNTSPTQISRACLRGRPCPPSLTKLWDAYGRGDLPGTYGIERLLSSLDVLESGYGAAIEAEGPETAANVRAHRRLFERLGFFAEDTNGALWAFDLTAFDLTAHVDEPPVVALDTEGRYSWLGMDLARVIARDESAASVSTQFLPGLDDLHRGYYAQERGTPRPPRRIAPRSAVAADPESWLMRPGAEVATALGATLPRENIVRCNGEGLVSTVWLPREGPLASLSVRGIGLGTDAAKVRVQLGPPTREKPAWVRYDGEGRALHLEIHGGIVTRITLMELDTAP